MAKIKVACFFLGHGVFFGHSNFSSVTTMLVELGLPSFNTVLHNAAAIRLFYKQTCHVCVTAVFIR